MEMCGEYRGSKGMFTIRTTIKMKDGTVVSNDRIDYTSVDAFDDLREQYDINKKRIADGEIENCMVELIPAPSWKGVLSYRMRICKP